MADENNTNIPQNKPVSLQDEMRSSYLDYAMSVIIGRAIPDARDGLKPVHRRILYAMHELRLSASQPYKKCAKVVGEVLGKYHPHGDASVYDALVRMAQDFSMRHMLIDGQGNFGSVDGDPPAPYRYTECRLSRIAAELLTDIEKDTVDFKDNYDGSESEPVVLPARVPNLLVNGAGGIAVGMATNIPPHDLGEAVRRNVGGHSDGDSARAIDEQVGNAGWEHQRLLLGIVEIGCDIDGVLFDVGEQLRRDAREATLGVAVGGRWIAVDGAEITLPVDEHVPHGEVLRHANERVVDRSIAMGVVFAEDLAHDFRALLVRLRCREPELVHRVQDAAVDGLEAIARVGNGAPDDDAHRIVEIRRTHLVLQADGFVLRNVGVVFVCHASLAARRLALA